MMRTIALALLAGSALAQDEHYTVEYFPTPPGAVLEVGGMDFFSDGSLALSTRRGQVWILENPDCEEPAQARFRLFAEGLREGLGLNIVDDQLYVLQRGELSRLSDSDGDGRCDTIETVANDWGLSGNYHEFAYGLPRFPDGDFLVTLNVSFFNPKWWHGKSPVPYRGWALKVSPQGHVQPWACGLRSPCGLGRDADGNMLITDNQGDWVAVCPIYHLRRGGFYGHPASLEWTPEYRASGAQASDEVPPAAAATRREPAAIWIPYKWSRSTGNLVPDLGQGSFGPFGRQLFVAELTNGMVLRAGMERVQGRLQGWITPFRQKIGSVVRVAFSPEGDTLFCGMTNRGWGGRPPADGLARIRYLGGTPFAIHTVHLLQDGFALTFTTPLAEATDLSGVKVSQYDYNYWWEYGSPPQHLTEREVRGLELSKDRRMLTVHVDGLEAGMVAKIELGDLGDETGRKLEVPEVHYTVNQLPEGPPASAHVSKIVPPPPSKESSFEGWLMLSWGDPLDRFEGSGWNLRNAVLDRADPTRFDLTEGSGALVNSGPDASNFVSKESFGDCKLHLGFMLPKGGDSGLLLMGRYELQLADSTDAGEPGVDDCGAIRPTETWAGAPPRYNGFRGPGEWHELDVVFEAPRFDAAGHKTRNARFESVQIDGKGVQEGIELPGATLGAPFQDEVPLGPLLLESGPSLVAFRDIRLLPTRLPDRGEGWTPLFTEADIDDWLVDGDAYWEFDGDTLVGTGPEGYCFTPRGDYRSFELRARIKISDGGQSGLYFRATPSEGRPQGYEVQVNSSYPDPEKCGSLYGIAPIKADLIPADTWARYYVRCEEVEQGIHIHIELNGVTIVDRVDTRRFGPGHIALEQHHEGSVVSITDVAIRELD